MRRILWSQLLTWLPNLSGYMGNGEITISDELYFSYMNKLHELMALRKQINDIARSQGLNVQGEN